MRVLVCGGRDFDNYAAIAWELDSLQPISLIIHGCASGADSLAQQYAEYTGTPVIQFPAQWGTLGRKAGPIRNQQMLDEGKPDLVIAFQGGRGTADMVRRAKKAGVKVIEVP